ncbi:MAG: tryptophan-rich sensory protein [Bacteroidetes bacterium]|nr:tryptophan-rich sensory protein [Bacteroidota bacterium]
MNKSKIIKLIVSIILPLAIGSIAGMFTSAGTSGWLDTLNSPSFRPPNWVFGPVWTILYLLMGFSLFLIWTQQTSRQRNLAIASFFVQLTLNFLWSFIFFSFHWIGIALTEIILLWVSIVIMLVLFYKIKPMAAYINIAYLLWVTFAAVLNASYYFLNRG